MEGATEASSASAGAAAPSAATATTSAAVTVSGSSAVVVGAAGATSVAASSAVSTSSSSGSASPTTVIGAPAANVTVDTSVAAAAMCVLHDAGRINAGTEDSSSGGGSNPHSPLTMDDDRQQQRRDRSNGNARDRTWRRIIHRELRDELINAMLQELQRITGQQNVRHLRMCASRYESFVWRKSDNQIQYLQKLERRIQSLRSQPSHCEQLHSAHMESAQALLESAQAQLQRLQRRQQEARLSHPPSTHCHHSSRCHPHRSMSSRRSRRHASSHRALPASSPSQSPRGATSSDHASRDERYFRRLRLMKIKYRDEVALVFRELCRVNTVIQHSASLRRHESNNLGDFLANLKKIIYLLEQQPDEMNGMIPARKRTIEYLDVVESHIQRKVLPILYRLRHTYSTILRPIVLNYLKNSARFSRR